MSESVIFELRWVENEGEETKNEHPISDISIYTDVGIFTNFDHFDPILEPWDTILQYLINLGVKVLYSSSAGLKMGE